MRRSTLLLLAGIELGLLGLWFLGLRYETGVDALQYHRMTNAIVQSGFAPWAISPLSYVGVYPGSDSSGVPFLAASFSMLSGISVGFTVLVYDATLLAIFGLGLFAVTHKFTMRADLALLAVLMGTLAYGFFATITWSLDERSFNVALTPIFFLLMLPQGTRTASGSIFPRMVSLGLTSSVMLVSHLSFLLLIPFLVLVPLLLRVVYRQYAFRRRRRASVLYFGAIGISPLLLLSALSGLGILTGYGLEYQLGSSALFSGSSPATLLLNAMVFLGTRVGAVNLGCAALGLLYLASRPILLPRHILLGGLLLAGFLGIPIVIYSKDLMTPIFVVLGVVGLGSLLQSRGRRGAQAIAVAAAVVVSGSVAFDSWNLARTGRAADITYWAMPGVTPEALDGNLWISAANRDSGCLYGNNAVLLQQVSTNPGAKFCTGLPVDVLINVGIPTQPGRSPLRVLYIGITGINPSSWFSSPDLERVSDDFARLPGLDFTTGRSLLLKYDVTFVVVDLRGATEIPLYSYQGTQQSRFFAELWNNAYPQYSSGSFAVFSI